MAEITRYIKHRRDTAANWTSNNPILKAGQLGIETDGLTTTPKFKIGDGTNTWSALPYFYGGALSAQNLNNVLSVGNTTGGTDMVITNDDIIQVGTTANRYIGFSTSTIVGGLELVNLNSNDHIILQDAGGIHIDTTYIQVPQVTASRILATDASNKITGAYTTTGSGTVLALSTSPTFVTDITTPLIIGGTAVGSGITYKSTTGNGTSGGAAHTFVGGNDGATTVFSLLNNGTATVYNTLNFGAAGTNGILSWGGSDFKFLGGATTPNVILGTPTHNNGRLKILEATGNILIGTLGSMTDDTTSELQVRHNIKTTLLHLHGTSASVAPIINFVPYSTTNSVINFYNTAGTTIRGFIDLNLSSGEMKIWAGSGGYFPTFGSNGSERMRIDTSGNVVVGTAAIATTATDGFLYLAASAGVPTGVPTAKTGRVPIAIDSTNNKMYIYSGGAWVALN